MQSLRLVPVPFDQAVDGETYLTRMKHGWIEGNWDEKSRTCSAYYYRDIEWYPEELYRIEQQEESGLATIEDFVSCCDQPNHPTTLVEKLPVNWQDDASLGGY
jgi:hypothetical protein